MNTDHDAWRADLEAAVAEHKAAIVALAEASGLSGPAATFTLAALCQRGWGLKRHRPDLSSPSPGP